MPVLSPSSERGVGHTDAATAQPSLLGFVHLSPLHVRPTSWDAFAALGVGHDPDAVPSVGRAKGGSGNTVPLTVMPDRSEPPEHFVQSAIAKGDNVFDDRPARADFGDEAEHFEPQAGTGASKAPAASGNTDILAGETAADRVNGNSVCFQTAGAELSDIIVNWHMRPMMCQDSFRERFDLTERNRFEPLSPFEAERKTTYSGKEVKQFQHVNIPNFPVR
jgi:hypothetical protein